MFTMPERRERKPENPLRRALKEAVENWKIKKALKADEERARKEGRALNDFTAEAQKRRRNNI